MSIKDFSFQFLNHNLKKLSFAVKEPKKITKEIPINPKIGMSWKIDEKKILAILQTVDIEGENLPFTLSVSIEGYFQLNGETPTKEEITKIAFINCGAVMFPFVRETIASITTRAGSAPLLLPSVNFINLYNVVKEASN